MEHRGADSYGFAFEEKSHRPFLADRAEALGVPAGPIRRELVAGATVTLADGRRVGPEDVLGPPWPGRGWCRWATAATPTDLVAVVRGADALVIEATYIEEEARDGPRLRPPDGRPGGAAGAENGVKQLYLTHISRRYRERDVLEEARRIFPVRQRGARL